MNPRDLAGFGRVGSNSRGPDVEQVRTVKMYSVNYLRTPFWVELKYGIDGDNLIGIEVFRNSLTSDIKDRVDDHFYVHRVLEVLSKTIDF